MLSRPPTLAIIFLLWVYLAHFVVTQHTSNPDPQLICRPFGRCEPCPEDALHEPFCKPFGNRRLVHCTPMTSTPPHLPPPPPPPPPSRPNAKVPPQHPPPSHPNPNTLQGETPAWESCGRIPEKEREDFWEFVACNVLFAIIFLFILFARSKRLQALKGRQLAARIGLVRGDGSGGGL